MIRSFRCRETQAIFDGRFSKRFPRSIQRVAARKLEMIAAATELNSLRIPLANRLEKLRGERQGCYSIRINRQWRICFRWRAGDAYEVEIVDYH